MPAIRLSTASVIAIAAATLVSTGAFARHHTPLPWERGPYVGPHQGQFHAPAHSPGGITSGTWTPVKAGFPGTSFPDSAVLLTDGNVMMHDGCTSDWYKLTPNKKGSYVNGTWKKTASMPSSYKPLYFSSQVLADGRLVVEGGEYNSCQGVWTNLGAFYDPAKDAWTAVTPPAGWSTIGDAQSVVLTNGTYMQANCCSTQSALASISGNNITWTTTGSGKADSNDEEGWTMLPDQTIITVDCNRDLASGFNDVEQYDPSTGKWTTIGKTADSLVDAGSHEIGPGPMLPNGYMFQVGATVNNDVYNPATNKWTAAKHFPSGDSADGPAAVLPNGRILAQVSPGVFNPPSHFFEIKVKSPSKQQIVQVNEPASAPNQSSYEGRMLVLPTGEVFWPSDVGDIEIYKPHGGPNAAWLPTITSAPASVTRGSTNNVVQGTQFNGFTFGGYYGDDAQSSTNYPLVRITNTGTKDVCYAKTHDHSSMGLSAPGQAGSTKFDVPNSCATGASTIQVVVNGIASAPTNITVN
ncbi:MAG TPA: hypothetical protein VLC74_02175 [Rhizomicrobium sp.]|nr:hypothetical protein [Rhizomicrobium sp.]